MDIKVVEPKSEDALEIQTVLHRSWLKTYPNKEVGITVDDVEETFKNSFSEEGLKKFQEVLKNIPANQMRRVAKIDGKVVGLITMVRNEGNNQLRTVYVDPEYQGKGVGTALWNEVKDFIDPTKETIVQVGDYNTQAIKFYEKLGFVDTGKRFKEERFRMKSGAIIPQMEMILKK